MNIALEALLMHSWMRHFFHIIQYNSFFTVDVLIWFFFCCCCCSNKREKRERKISLCFYFTLRRNFSELFKNFFTLFFKTYLFEKHVTVFFGSFTRVFALQTFLGIKNVYMHAGVHLYTRNFHIHKSNSHFCGIIAPSKHVNLIFHNHHHYALLPHTLSSLNSIMLFSASDVVVVAVDATSYIHLPSTFPLPTQKKKIEWGEFHISSFHSLYGWSSRALLIFIISSISIGGKIYVVLYLLLFSLVHFLSFRRWKSPFLSSFSIHSFFHDSYAP